MRDTTTQQKEEDTTTQQKEGEDTMTQQTEDEGHDDTAEGR
jgi:hypothetical protein